MYTTETNHDDYETSNVTQRSGFSPSYLQHFNDITTFGFFQGRVLCLDQVLLVALVFGKEKERSGRVSIPMLVNWSSSVYCYFAPFCVSKR